MIDLQKVNEKETNLVCKLTDFGFMSALEYDGNYQKILGSAHYLAPELI